MPSNWVDRDDRVAGNCAAGPVNDDEPVVRLLDTETFKDGKIQDAAFQREHLFPPKGRPPENTPGSRGGESLIRSAALAHKALMARAAARPRPPRTSEGYAVATVADIRKITSNDNASARLFRIYEDPDPTNDLPEHAVIRFDPAFKTQWTLARHSLIALFHRA